MQFMRFPSKRITSGLPVIQAECRTVTETFPYLALPRLSRFNKSACRKSFNEI